MILILKKNSRLQIDIILKKVEQNHECSSDYRFLPFHREFDDVDVRGDYFSTIHSITYFRTGYLPFLFVALQRRAIRLLYARVI